MSVKGFKEGNTVIKYDYNSLDNLPDIRFCIEGTITYNTSDYSQTEITITTTAADILENVTNDNPPILSLAVAGQQNQNKIFRCEYIKTNNSSGSFIDTIQFKNNEILGNGDFYEESIDVYVTSSSVLTSYDRVVYNGLPNQFLNSIATVYDQNSAYAVGDYVIYDNTLYKCAVAKAEFDPWVTANWTAVSITDEFSQIEIDASLSVSGAAADAKATGDEITDLKADLSEISNGKLKLNINDSANAYIKNPTVGTTISLSSSSRTIVFKKIIAVEDEHVYIIKIQESDSPIFAGSRDSVITDSSDVVQQVFSYTNIAGEESAIRIESSVNGYLYLSVDPNYANITIEDTYIKEKLPEIQGYINDIVTNTIDIDSWIGKNLYNPNTAMQGRILLSNGSLGSSSDTYASDYIPISENARYVVTPQISSSVYGAAFYNENKEFISSMSLKGSGTNGLYPIVFNSPQGAAYFRFTMWHTLTAKARLYEYSPRVFRDLLTTLPVDGNPILLHPTVNIRKAYETSQSYRQGGTVFNGKLFSVNNNLTNCCLVDLYTGESTAVTTNNEFNIHGNVVGFGNVFNDENDPFPVVYISGEGESGFCGVFRIVENNGSYSLVLLCRIIFPNTGYAYFNLVIDTERDCMYLRGQLPDNSGNVGFIKYNLLKTFTSDITLEYEEKSEQHPNGYLEYFRYYPRFISNRSAQDAFIHGDRYYCVLGNASNACMNVIDMNNGQLLSFIDLTPYISVEIETCALFNDCIVLMSIGGIIYVVTPNVL